MGFSSKLPNHNAALGLYLAAYNFLSKHSALKTTLAVGAEFADAPWTVEELIERTACYDPSRPTAWEQFLDGLPDDA